MSDPYADLVIPPPDDSRPASAVADLADRLVDGGSFVLDAPDTVPTVWGRDGDVLWARGESLILAGPPGVGKTTLTGQIVRGLVGLQADVLGYPIEPAAGRVLYLAMDRPQQIARSLRRHFHDDERDVLSRRLVVWKGPPPSDLARVPDMLAVLAAKAGASHVVLDSLKDAALGLTEDETGAGYNRARQLALAQGVDILELHHVVKRGANGAKPTTLADLYGSAWITAGAGSVVLLWGAAGDPIVDLTHLKPPAEPVGPLRVSHDHTAGVSTIWHATDALSVVQNAGPGGLGAADLARVMYETEDPDRNEVEKARRRLEKLTADGLIEQIPSHVDPRGGPARSRYRALTRALTRPSRELARTTHGDTHAGDKTPGQLLTPSLTARTKPSTHVSQPPFKGGGTRAPHCTACKNPLPTDPALVHDGRHLTCDDHPQHQEATNS